MVSFLKEWGCERVVVPILQEHVTIQLATDTDGEPVLYISLPLEEKLVRKKSNMKKGHTV